MWRRTWEQCSPEIRDVAKRIKIEHAPKARCRVQGLGFRVSVTSPPRLSLDRA